jgi:hypothetical protein
MVGIRMLGRNFEGRESFSPVPASEVVGVTLPTVRGRFHRETLWQKAITVFGEDFKVTA